MPHIQVAPVQAVASAFASAVVGARSTCDPPLCEVTQDVLTHSIETILAKATASVVTAQCSTRSETFSTTVLEEDIMTVTAKALSAVYAQSTVVGGVCDLTFAINATIDL